jgi:hypothetical protein
MPSRQGVTGFHVARDLGRHTQSDPATPHFGKANRALATIGLVRQAAFALANLFEGLHQVAVPFQRVHREIEVRVEQEHGC